MTTKKLATIRGMATGLAVLMTCLYTACGGGTGTDVVAADGSATAMPQAAASSVVAGSGDAALPSSGGVPASAPVATAPVVGAPASAPAATAPVVGAPASAPAAPAPVAGTGSSTVVAVDLTKIPPAGAGTSAMNVAPTTEIAPPGGGEFRTVCAFAHMSFDDPIVFPGQPGRSHLHTFFGNTSANANSTAESLRKTGNSTCRGGIANRSAYWVPTMIDTKTNTPIKADEISVYYKNGFLNGTLIKPIPAGLRMIAGDPDASAPHEEFSMRWKCIGGPNKQNDHYGPTLPNCDAGAQIWQEIFFPQCWDGVNLDSPDHKSHMSYTIPNPANPTQRLCPATHPHALPGISFNVMYTVPAKDAPLSWRLASDNYDRSKPAGYSSHGDWFNGWDSGVSDAWAKNCIEAQKDCHGHLLGDGRKIF